MAETLDLGQARSVGVLALVALVFVYPHLMVSPGPLVPGHRALATDCFACHAPLRGASSAKCVQCHATTDIGLRTTHGRIPLTGVMPLASSLDTLGWFARVPMVLQTEAAECGLACLAMVATYHGLKTDLPTLRRRRFTTLLYYLTYYPAFSL